MTAEGWSRVRGRLGTPRTFLTCGALLVAVAIGFVIPSAFGSAGPSGGVVIEGQPSLVSYHGANPKVRGSTNSDIHFTIGGDATRVLYPNGTSPIDLTFTNPSSTSITLPPTAVTITKITTPTGSNCTASANFTVVQNLTARIKITAGATKKSLTAMGIAKSDWPVIKMRTTTFKQNTCAGVTVTLTYFATVQSAGTVTKATTGSGTGSGSGSGSQNGASPRSPSPVPVQTATAPSGSALAFTGFDVLLVGGSGVLLVSVGLVLSMWRRREEARR